MNVENRKTIRELSVLLAELDDAIGDIGATRKRLEESAFNASLRQYDYSKASKAALTQAVVKLCAEAYRVAEISENIVVKASEIDSDS
jgi:phage shock protein A